MLNQETMIPGFTNEDAGITELLDYMHEIEDLKALGSLAEWDQNTEMPEGAGEVRGYQLATLQGTLHDRWTTQRLGTLLNELSEVLNRSDYTVADRGLVREAQRNYDRATKLPRKLVEELARVQSGSFEAWRRAREHNDFASFAPWLSRTVALQREVADRIGYAETRYDALLDLFEPGMTASKLDKLFAPVREVSTTLLRRIEASGTFVDDSCLQGEFSEEQQVELSDVLLRAMGYDFSHGGIAVSPHPFTTSFGSPFDVRLTVHPDKHFIQSSVMAAIHEGGHAVYEQGSASSLARTPLAGGASMGAHESQSRLWENAIGRSEAYWRGQFAAVRQAFPERFATVNAAAFARALNRVKPSLIRIEADEVTYNLHIIVRYELEKALINGDVTIESLPGLWNAKYHEYLGIEPRNDSEGVLQDIHWSSGFGYFPSYTLGNLYSAQIYSALRKHFPNFDEQLASGDTAF
ncbi:MAG TPA: carboxypeptidase M32, partial [Ktedonobacteraceae bacterium]|nr:carboxypeptidase M32 [Ktedonobacteraceae bacterium]